MKLVNSAEPALKSPTTTTHTQTTTTEEFLLRSPSKHQTQQTDKVHKTDRTQQTDTTRPVQVHQATQVNISELLEGLKTKKEEGPTEKTEETPQKTAKDLHPLVRKLGFNRSLSQPASTFLNNKARTPTSRTPEAASKLVVRGNPFLVRLLSYPDPVLNDMESTVKKLEEELDGIEKRWKKHAEKTTAATPSATPSPSVAPAPATPPHVPPLRALPSSSGINHRPTLSPLIRPSTPKSPQSSSPPLSPPVFSPHRRYVIPPSPLPPKRSWFSIKAIFGLVMLLFVAIIAAIFFRRYPARNMRSEL